MTRRLTLLFILLLTGCAAVACAVQLWTSMQYGNAMVQRLSGGLAQHIAQRETLLDANGQVDRTRLKPLFDRLMTFNPSVELYILSPDGRSSPMLRRRGISSGKSSLLRRCSSFSAAG